MNRALPLMRGRALFPCQEIRGLVPVRVPIAPTIVVAPGIRMPVAPRIVVAIDRGIDVDSRRVAVPVITIQEAPCALAFLVALVTELATFAIAVAISIVSIS